MPTESLAPPQTVVRVLPATEHSRLLGLPFAERGLPNPDLTIILVSETAEGEIVGVWSAMTAVHLDGLWVAPPYRKRSRVGVQLLRGMRRVLAELGIVESFTYTESAEVLVLALKTGWTRLPGDLLRLDLRPRPQGD